MYSFVGTSNSPIPGHTCTSKRENLRLLLNLKWALKNTMEVSDHRLWLPAFFFPIYNLSEVKVADTKPNVLWPPSMWSLIIQ